MPSNSVLTRGFGQVMRSWRHQAGLTQEQLAEAADLTPRYVGQLERGLQSPTLRVVESIALSLKRRPWELIREAEGVSVAGPGMGADGLGRS